MKKIVFIPAIISVVILLSGCGNDLKVTVYNASGVVSVGLQYIAIDANTGAHDQWFVATDTATSSDNIDSNNSFVFTAKENDTLNVSANGQKYDSTGNTANGVTAFQVPASTQVLYGGFLDNPQWYAAVNLQSVVIYKK